LTDPGKIGQEVGTTMAVSLEFLEVPVNRAQELDEAIFEGYCAGLRNAGLPDDLRQAARFGYTVTAALNNAVAFAVFVAGELETPSGRAIAEKIIGHPFDEIMEQWSILQPFLLDLGDEALALMESI
jgi:hypothetical protein